MNPKKRREASSEPLAPKPAAKLSNNPAPGPDVRQLREQELPGQTFPGGREQRFRIYVDPAIHRRLWQHARESLEVEVCGVLVGSWGKDAGGPFVVVSEAIRGEAATSKFAEVTFTHETWAKINHEMDSKYAQLAIVGWYHTHPDFGIFLSDRDVFIQQHFFSGPGQVAYVLDPVRSKEGIFIWQEGKPTPAPHYWIGDQLQTGDTSQPGDRAEPQSSVLAVAGGEHLPASPEVASGSFLSLLMNAMVYLAVFLIGYLLAGRLTDAERQHLEQEVVARSALFLGVKPGLREAIERCLADLNAGEKEAKVLAADLPEEQRERWNTIRDNLSLTQSRLRGLQTSYCLSPAETQHLVELSAAVLALSAQGITNAERNQLAQRLEKQYLQILKEGIGEARGETRPENAPKAESAAPSSGKREGQ